MLLDEIDELATELAESRRQLQAVDEVIAHARRISPSDAMHVYIADLERALGMDAARPHKLGQRDGETT